MSVRISPQAAGALGEHAVEVELLRHGWILANVNATVRCCDFDIFAVKDDKTVLLRVRARAPRTLAYFSSAGSSPTSRCRSQTSRKTISLVLVAISSDRARDEFYVMPSRVVREEIILRQKDYLAIAKKDGTQEKKHRTLGFAFG